jgi:uncharacterized membrane protein YhaH (DUF805 family)
MDDYPILGAFLTILWLFLFIAWIAVLINVFRDIFRSDDMSGFAKAAWTLLVVVLPLLGVLVYLVARGSSMHRRDIEEATAREQAMQDYIRTVAQSAPPAPTGTQPAVPQMPPQMPPAAAPH